jgi:hypothetical protein
VATPPAIQVDLLPKPPALEVDRRDRSLAFFGTLAVRDFSQVSRSRLSKETATKLIPSITATQAKQDKDNHVRARAQERG